MSRLESQQLPRIEKMRLMEDLWSDLSREEGDLDSPAWHGAALAETAQRLSAGKEQVLDWNQAKAKLRQGAA